MIDELTPLHPNHRILMIVQGAIIGLPLLIGGIVVEITGKLPTGLAIVPAAIVALWLMGFAPLRRYRHKGYRLAQDRLRVVKGWLFHSDTVVPFGRVQHIDVLRSPLQRPFDLATLVLHTAGTHNSSVQLPGLLYDDAQAMRETIRAFITRETTGVLDDFTPEDLPGA